ncbi:unnamed protein product, partial [Mesorhabditis belari]|uniref:Uncharacterized protein n=1 Tax=Mesorhabditis belari TaxID=2138241 RepID=A0A915G613_9BILA
MYVQSPNYHLARNVSRAKPGLLCVLLFTSCCTQNLFAEALVNTVLIGGDTDTNGCIGAALLGAHFGETRIPLKWREKVKKAAIRIKEENGIIPVKEIVQQRKTEQLRIVNTKPTKCLCCSKGN